MELEEQDGLDLIIILHGMDLVEMKVVMEVEMEMEGVEGMANLDLLEELVELEA